MAGKFRNKPLHKGMRPDKRAAMFKEHQAKIKVVVDEDKSHLEPYVGDKVKFSGDVVCVPTKVPTLMLYDVSICGGYLDHLWITLDKKSKDKIQMAIINRKRVRIYFEGTIRRYISSKDDNRFVKHGVYNVTLVGRS